MESLTIVVQVVGSIASILGIPLAIYLYLRQRESNLRKVRDQILDILSRQIGEGRRLTVFELRAVIDSIIRKNSSSRKYISDDSIITDLVAQTVANPMLATDQKHEVISNLQELHSEADLYARFTDLESAKTEIDIEEVRYGRKTPPPSEPVTASKIFAFLVSLVSSILAGIVISTDLFSILSKIDLSRALPVLSLMVSFIAMILTQGYIWFFKKHRDKTGDDADSLQTKEANKCMESNG